MTIHITRRHGTFITCPHCPFSATLTRDGVRVDIPGSAPHTGATPWGWWRWLRKREITL